jgi:cis-L-3-hydroxyproline dehydratase
MYHIAGITPEAPDVETALGGKAPKATVKITQADLERVREQFAGTPGPIEYAMFGCPHLTIRQIGEVAEQLQGRRFAVDTWLLVSSLTLELADRMGYLATIQRAGGHVLPDTCMDVPGCWDMYYGRPGVTESQKCAFYCQVYGQDYAVRPLRQAIEAAIAGEVH